MRSQQSCEYDVRAESSQRSRAERGERRKTEAGSGALRCRRKFLRFFPDGFSDEDYIETERDYKWQCHLLWRESLNEGEFGALLRAGRHDEIAARALRIEQRSRYSMLFSFEKMALRDAVRSSHGAQTFAAALFAYLHGKGELEPRFEAWVDAVASLPRKQTRVLTWPVVTVFGFIAQPDRHIFVKPNTLRAAARAYGFDLEYQSRPDWRTYSSVLELAALVSRDQRDLGPRDMIDVQSFLWVQGSAEYD
jgi:hypothetical protein